MILELTNDDVLEILKDWFIDKYKEKPSSISFDFVQVDKNSFSVGVNICTD